MRALLALSLLAACSSQGGQYPPGTAPLLPGSSGTQGRPDAGTAGDAPDGGPAITGEICGITDVVALTPCTPLTGTRLTVSVLETGAQTTVGADGRFTLPAPAGLTRATLVTSTTDLTWFGSAVATGAGGATTIPVMRQADVTDLALGTGAALVRGRGVVVVHTLSGATLDAIGGVAPFYDTGPGGMLTAQPPTGPAGVAVYFDVPPGPVAIAIRTGNTTRTVTTSVVADAVDFVDAP